MRVPGFVHLKDLKRPQMVELIDPVPGARGQQREALLGVCGLIYTADEIVGGLPELETNEGVSPSNNEQSGGDAWGTNDAGRASYGPMALDEARYHLSFINPTFDGDKDGPVYKDWAGRVKALLLDPEALPLQNETGELLEVEHPQRKALVRDWCDKTLWNKRTGETGKPDTFVSWEHVQAEIKGLPSRGDKRLIRWGTFVHDARKTPGYVPYARAKLPVVRLFAGQLHQVVRDLDHALANAKCPTYPHEPAVYRQQGRFVTVEEEEEADFASTSPLKRDKGVPVTKTVTLPRLRILAARNARIENFVKTRGGWVSANLPDLTGSAYLQSEEDACPFLRGVIEAPTILADGTILQRKGFDPKSGLLLRLAYEFPSILDHPTRDEAMAALQRLRRPFRALEFESGDGIGIDADVVVAAILTGIARPALRYAPMFFFSAPQPGSGKSLMAKAVSKIVTGHGGAVITLAEREEETEKRLGAAFMAGDPVIIIDNCSRPVGGDFLCVVLTEPLVHPRRLGLSINVRCSTKALIIATGNNLSAVGDLAGRCVLSYIRPRTESPQKREFDFDMIDEVERDRPGLVAAALTISRAYIAAECPKIPDAKPSRFSDWDRFVRFPVIWAGGCDIQPAMDKVLENDARRSALGSVLDAWHSLYGSEEKVLGDVVTETKLEMAGAINLTPEQSNLRGALKEAIPPGKTGARDANQLGYWLRSRQNVPVGGLEFRKGAATKSGRRWRVERSPPEG
jgi:hypothetical protein